MRIEIAVGQFFGQLLLERRIEEVFHPLGRFVQVIAGQIEVRGEIAFPQAVRSDNSFGLFASLRSQASANRGPALPAGMQAGEKCDEPTGRMIGSDFRAPFFFAVKPGDDVFGGDLDGEE